jgi:acetyl esterase/lipase
VSRTVVSIQGDMFQINDQATYTGRTWRGMKIEGLLLNSRMVQGIYDDANPQAVSMWNYSDGPWDPDRNTREFIEAMPLWRERGLLSFTLNLQGGSPQGYSKSQPWDNSAFEADGSLKHAYFERLQRILNKADELGMVPILGFFYFGQDERLRDETAVVRATCNATDWLLNHGYGNVLIEIDNECNVNRYEHEILKPGRVDELIRLVQTRSQGKVRSPAGRLLVSTSMGGGAIPPESIVRAADFVLLHGNGVKSPDRIRSMVDECRTLPAYHGQPILFNEDDHFDFDEPDNNMLAALSRYSSWGLFDYRMKGEGYDEGYQSVPVNWGISSARKKGFFRLLAEVTGSTRIKVVEYKKVGDVRLEMSIIAPPADTSRPAVVWFVCGAWSGFSPLKQYPHAEYLASRGVVNFIALVRVEPQHGTTPAECVTDAKSAIRWVRMHAAEYGVDPDRIVAAGGSAGGHVAACTALIDGFDDPRDDLSVSCKPNALALYCPALNVHSEPRRVELFGGMECARQLSPVLHVKPGDPPTIIMHGKDDNRVLPEDSVAFAVAMKAAGNRCDLKLYDGEGHGFQNYFEGKNRAFYETMRATDEFLASLGYIHGKPTIDPFHYDGPRMAKPQTVASKPGTEHVKALNPTGKPQKTGAD